MMKTTSLARLALALAPLVVVGCASSDEKPPPPAPATAPVAAAPKKAAPPEFRLPDDVVPTRYALDLTLVPEEDTFRGVVKIDVTLAAARDTIWLHGARFEIDDARFTPEGQAPVTGTFATVDEAGLAGLTLPTTVGPGKGTIELHFRGEWDTSLKGLYKVTEEGKAYVFTQMEPLGARYAFPCFDEPRFKVPFAITVTSKAEHQIIANTRETARVDVEPDLVKVSFAETLPLPTYLIAFAVGPLDIVDLGGLAPNAVRTTTLPFRGVAVSGRGAKLAFAMQKTAPILEALERYFGAPYPFDKLDIIAVPDFASGAMENPGAITFREWLLLIDDAASANQKRATHLVVAHELAHMWFGDAVTMPWWDDLWLNEAFATWMAYRVVDEVAPELGASLALVERAQGAMGFDALVSARQIRQPVLTNDDIDNAFDSITYSKGGAVLAMFERNLGPETFQKGIRAYITEHAGGNATTSDLLRALSTAAGRDVATPFQTFLDQPGVPLVDATLVCEGDTARVDVTQARYLPPGSTGDADRRWQIPLCIKSGTGDQSTETCALITEPKGSVALPGACPAWFLPNASGAGYIRPVVDEAALQALLKGTPARPITAPAPAKKAIVKPPPLPAAERLAVADMVRAAFATGRLDVEGLLRVLPALAADPERAVARVPIELLTFLHDEVVSDKERANVEAAIRGLYNPVLKRIGLVAKKGESPDARQFRAMVADLLARVARDTVVEGQLAALGRAYANPDKGFALNPAAVDADLTAVALQAAVRMGDDAFFDGLKAKLESETDATARVVLLQGLSASTDPARAARYRAIVFDPDTRTNEVDQIALGAFFARENRTAAWEAYTGELDRLIARAPTTRAANLVYMGAWFCTAARADEVKRVFTPHLGKLTGGPRELEGVAEMITLCAARADLHRAKALAVFQTKPDFK